MALCGKACGVVPALLWIGVVACKPAIKPVKSAVWIQTGQSGIGRFIETVAPCADEANGAALNKLYPLLGQTDVKSAVALDNAEKSIACLRPWADALTDSCQRNSLLSWLEYYSGRISAARKELAQGITETDLEKYRRELREKEVRVREWERLHPFPKLPQCSP